jgi:FtsP/CotA-like multicopper oxidase with cupredoxin domain
MHLHGHHFQVVAISGTLQRRGARHVGVPHMAEVTIAFDTDNPGNWPFYCHHLYHMAAGMMGYVACGGAA